MKIQDLQVGMKFADLSCDVCECVEINESISPLFKWVVIGGIIIINAHSWVFPENDFEEFTESGEYNLIEQNKI